MKGQTKLKGLFVIEHRKIFFGGGGITKLIHGDYFFIQGPTFWWFQIKMTDFKCKMRPKLLRCQ